MLEVGTNDYSPEKKLHSTMEAASNNLEQNREHNLYSGYGEPTSGSSLVSSVFRIFLRNTFRTNLVVFDFERREGEEKGKDFLLCHEKFITPNLSPENCVSIIEIFT